MKKHIVQLDGLRFFAVLMVMIAHWAQWKWTNPLLTKFPFVHGVTLFFVLSGYLITAILMKNSDKYEFERWNKFKLIKNFYLKRILRIFPIYYLLIIFLFIINYDNTRALFPWLISYSSNIYQSIHNVYVGNFNHFWSLAVEEQFYLFWPFVILFVKPKNAVKVIFITIIISLIVRIYLYFYVGKWMATSYFTLSCMHALGLGALLAYVKLYKPKYISLISKPVWLYLVGVLYVFSLIIQNIYKLNWYKEILDEFFFAILAFFVIFRASENKFKGFFKWILENKFIVYSGKISYGMYVYHLFIPTIYYYISSIIGFSINNSYVLFIALYLITFMISHISWLVIESPLNKLKDKISY